KSKGCMARDRFAIRTRSPSFCWRRRESRSCPASPSALTTMFGSATPPRSSAFGRACGGSKPRSGNSDVIPSRVDGEDCHRDLYAVQEILPADENLTRRVGQGCALPRHAAGVPYMGDRSELQSRAVVSI